MNLFIDFTPIPQTPDSIQKEQSFIQQNDHGFMGQQSIMSADFNNNSLDSIVEIKTKKLRRHKKIVKSYKYFDSNLIVKKDSFAFLKNIKNPQKTIFNINSYLYQSSLNKQTHIIKADSTVIIDSVKTNNTALNVNENTIIPSESNIITKSTTLSYLSKDTNNHTPTKTTITNKISVSREIPATPIIKTTDKINKSLSGEIWLIGILFSVLFLFAFAKMQFNSKLKLYYRSLFSYQFFYKMYKEQNTTTQRTGFILSTIFYINMSLVIFYSIHELRNLTGANNHFFLFSKIFIILLFTIVLFTILNKLLSFVFESYEIINEYLYNIYFFNRILGLTLLPLVVIYPYLSPIIAPYILYLSLTIISLFIIFRWFRGLQISFKYRISYFYMFLYLCILEITPLLFIFKII